MGEHSRHVAGVSATYTMLDQLGAAVVPDDIYNLALSQPEEGIFNLERALREQAEERCISVQNYYWRIMRI